jgi:anti-sigma regulatory factor (Ser/Thr protein kinase)
MADELKVKNDMAEVDKIRNYLKNNLKELNLSDKDYYKIEVSLLEIVLNIIRYAYPQEVGDIFIKTWQKEDKIFIEIRDNGIPFDPRKAELPDIKELIKNEKVGGLGIFLSRRLMDGFEYKRESNQNILTMYKKIEEAEASDSSV